jgi:hypothetical protein
MDLDDKQPLEQHLLKGKRSDQMQEKERVSRPYDDIYEITCMSLKNNGIISCYVQIPHIYLKTIVWCED